jgi:hypothetical protein
MQPFLSIDQPAVEEIHLGRGGRRPAAEGGRPRVMAVSQVRAPAGDYQVRGWYISICRLKFILSIRVVKSPCRG